MFRKSLFLGLTMMLAAVLVYLVIEGRRREKQQSTVRPVEVVRESTPSRTRVIGPGDLEIVESKTELATSGAQIGQPVSKSSPAAITATHRITIRSNARIAYRNLALKFSYLGRGEKVLETRTVPVAEFIQPGQARALAEIKEESLPAGTLKCLATIAYADIESLPKQP